MNGQNSACLEQPRILVFSQRDIFGKIHYRCILSEFEDLICQMDSVELLRPRPKERFKYGTRAAQRLAVDYAIAFNPGIPKQKVDRGYDIFFAFCQFAKDLLHVESVVGWEKCSKVSVCWLDEIWLSEFHKYRYYLDILSKFDLVVTSTKSSLEALNEVVGDKASFLPLGIDSVLFCPYPDPPARAIDMYSIGRRSEITHNELMKMAKENNFFYIYDSINGDRVINSKQHRQLFASIAKRSKYFLVNPGKFDTPGETNTQSEIGSRFFEGCAAGTIMIGERPNCDVFEDIFYWPDAVISMPFDAKNIADIIGELERDPERRKRISSKNVIEALNKHDWLYRWKSILRKTGMEPLTKMMERQNSLNALCEAVKKDSDIMD